MRRTASWAVGARRCIAPRLSEIKQETRRLECTQARGRPGRDGGALWICGGDTPPRCVCVLQCAAFPCRARSASGTSSSHHRVECTDVLQAVARRGPRRIAIVASFLARSIQGGAVHFCDHQVSFLKRYCVLSSDGVRALSHAGLDACFFGAQGPSGFVWRRAEVMFRTQSYPGLHPQSERAPSQQPSRCWTLGLRTCTVKVPDTPRKACWEDTLRFLRPVRCSVPYTLVETRAWSCIRDGRRATFLCVNWRQLQPWWMADRPGEHAGPVRSCLKGCI